MDLLVSGMHEMTSESEQKGPKEQYRVDAYKRIYEQCIEIRNFEIGQLSNRNNFLMIFQGVLFAGLVQSQAEVPIVSFMACATGLLVSWSQTKIAAGAKYWQEYWETEVVNAEIRLLAELEKESSDDLVKLFTKDKEDIRVAVYQRLGSGKTDFFTSSLIMRKFSVSRVPIQLGVVLMVIWGVLLLSTVNLGWCISVSDFITGFKK